MATVQTQPSGNASASTRETGNQGKPLSVEEEYVRNCEVARRIMQAAKRGSDQWRMGQYVGLSKGEVIVVSTDVEETFAALRQVEPDRHRGMVFKVRDPDEVVYDL